MRSPEDPRLLCVEPERPAREAMAAALLAEGYRVDTAASGAAGLHLLRHGAYDLVISRALPSPRDPDHAWLARAAEAGILGRAISLLVSPEPGRPRDFDLPLLLAQVHSLLAAAGTPGGGMGEAANATVEPLARARVDGHAAVELTLYVSTHSPSSLRAQRRLATFMSRFPAGHVALTVRDLAVDPRSAQDEDRVIFTPTLVRKVPQPKVWVIGDLEDAQLILDLLTTAGVEPSP